MSDYDKAIQKLRDIETERELTEEEEDRLISLLKCRGEDNE